MEASAVASGYAEDIVAMAAIFNGIVVHVLVHGAYAWYGIASQVFGSNAVVIGEDGIAGGAIAE